MHQHIISLVNGFFRLPYNRCPCSSQQKECLSAFGKTAWMSVNGKQRSIFQWGFDCNVHQQANSLFCLHAALHCITFSFQFLPTYCYFLPAVVCYLKIKTPESSCKCSAWLCFFSVINEGIRKKINNLQGNLINDALTGTPTDTVCVCEFQDSEVLQQQQQYYNQFGHRSAFTFGYSCLSLVTLVAIDSSAPPKTQASTWPYAN